MTRFLSKVISAAAALAFLLVLAALSPSIAQQPNSVNPTASSVKEQQLLQELNRVEGRISIPDTKEGVLIQPAGQGWRFFHEVVLRWIGAIAVIGMLALLVIFYF